jgi:hypothetical protein
MSALERYTALTDEQLASTTNHSPDDDARLDEMDVLWEEMTPAEQEEARYYAAKHAQRAGAP